MWIKLRTKLKDDGRVMVVSRKCNASSVTVLGALVTLWCYADDHADQNGVMFGWTAADIDQRVGVAGFAQALPTDWIDLTGEWVKLPEYQEHNGTTGKSRAQNSKRVAKYRGNAQTVTRPLPKALPEKKREEEIRSNTPLPPKGKSSSKLIKSVKDIQNYQEPDFGYSEALQEWLDYRTELGKPYRTSKGIVQLMRSFPTTQQLRAAARQSIKNEWQGLFPDKGGKAQPQSYADEVSERWAKAGLIDEEFLR